MLKRLLRDKRGVSMVIVAVTLAVSVGFAIITIDVSFLLLAKNQLQAAADAGALAGAIAFYLSGGDDAQATTEAITVAGLNCAVENTQTSVVVLPEDVTITGDSLITVVTQRTHARGTPVARYFLRVLDPDAGSKGNVMARATARVFPAHVTCLRPWAIPDQWDDTDNDSVYDTTEFYDPEITGYKPPDDVGREVILMFANPNSSEFKTGWYYPINLPPLNTGDPETGGDAYRNKIAECDTSLVSIGDSLRVETGAMVGPTKQGLLDLLGQDPNAQWDPVSGDVINSDFPVSPRVIKIACFDPSLGIQSAPPDNKFVTVVKIIVLFLEGVNNQGDVYGRFIQRSSDGEICPDCPMYFVFKAALVE